MNGIIALLFISSLFAHDEHNWTTDKKAYEYTQNNSARQISTKNFKTLNINLKLDMSYYTKKLRQFTGLDPIVVNGEEIKITNRRSEGYRNLSIHFLESEFQKLGFTTTQKPYSSRNWFPTKGVNLISERQGVEPSKTLVLVSHYDSVGNAGANDNGTGTIGMLTIAKAFKDLNLKYNLRFIQFDQEELGLIGSRAYVSQLGTEEKNQILAVINVDMIGTDSDNDGKFHIMDCDKQHSTPYANTFIQVIDAYKFDLEYVPGCTNRSDHAPFWNVNIPAVLISENFFGGDSDPCYHSSCDIFDDRIKLQYTKNILKTIALGLLHIMQ